MAMSDHPGFTCACGAHFDDVFPLHKHMESECTNPYSVLEVVSCWRAFNYMPVSMRKAVMRALEARPAIALEERP